MKRKVLLVSILIVGLVSFLGLSSVKKSVVINEVSWAGTKASWADEWIELHNVTEEEINLEGYRLVWDEVVIPLGKEKKNTLTLKNKTIPPEGYYLLERSDEATVDTVKADLIFKGGLSNSGEKIKLLNKEGKQVDSVDFREGWPAGQTGEGDSHYSSMVLKEGEWVTNKEKSEQKDADGNPIYGSPSSGPDEN